MAWECLVVAASWFGECCQVSRNLLSLLSKDKMETMIICVSTTTKTVRRRKGWRGEAQKIPWIAGTREREGRGRKRECYTIGREHIVRRMDMVCAWCMKALRGCEWKLDVEM